jgi:hypothetical protein
VSEDLAIAAAFDDLLLEVAQLRKASGRIENLARKYIGMEEKLLSASGSVHDIATVLNLSTLIRSQGGSSQEDAPDLQHAGVNLLLGATVSLRQVSRAPSFRTRSSVFFGVSIGTPFVANCSRLI